MGTFEFAWKRDDRSHCGFSAVSAALETISLSWTGDPQVDEEINDIEYARDTCPENVDDALEHLLREARSNDTAFEYLREAIDALQAHGKHCDCADEKWMDARDQVDRYLSQLPQSIWIVDEPDAGVAHDDLPDAPDLDDVLGGLLNAGDDSGYERAPDALESLKMRWNGYVLVLEVVADAHRTLHLEPLGADAAVVASLLDGANAGSGGTTPGHFVSSFDADVVSVVASLLRAPGLPSGTQNGPGAASLLEEVSDLKARSRSHVWEAVTRLAPDWAGSPLDLAAAAAAVLEPVG